MENKEVASESRLNPSALPFYPNKEVASVSSLNPRARPFYPMADEDNSALKLAARIAEWLITEEESRNIHFLDTRLHMGTKRQNSGSWIYTGMKHFEQSRSYKELFGSAQTYEFFRRLIKVTYLTVGIWLRLNNKISLLGDCVLPVVYDMIGVFKSMEDGNLEIDFDPWVKSFEVIEEVLHKRLLHTNPKDLHENFD